MKNFIQFIWQLPQNICGAALWLVVRFFLGGVSRSYTLDGGVRCYYVLRFRGGVSLGRFIFLHDYPMHLAVGARQRTAEKHEFGHTKQSLYLGWLYLLVIGLPSIIHAAFYKYDPADRNGYYRFYTEKWADKLGGVER